MLEFRPPATAKIPDPEKTPVTPAVIGIEITCAWSEAGRVERRLIAVREGHHFVTRIDGLLFHGRAESKTSNWDLILAWDVQWCEHRTDPRIEGVMSNASGRTLIRRWEGPIVTLPIEFDGRPETLVIKAGKAPLQERPSPRTTVWQWPDRSDPSVRPLRPAEMRTIEIALRRSDSPEFERRARIRSTLAPGASVSWGRRIDYVLDYDAEIQMGGAEITGPVWATVAPGIQTQIVVRDGRPVLTWRLCLLRWIEKIELSVQFGNKAAALEIPRFVVREGERLLLPGPNSVDLGETANGSLELLVSLEAP
jgi:hypothetical protein